MNIAEMIKELEDIKQQYGDLPIFLADRYAHYTIKRVKFSDASDGPHVCVRMDDVIKYDVFVKIAPDLSM